MAHGIAVVALILCVMNVTAFALESLPAEVTQDTIVIFSFLRPTFGDPSYV